MRQDIEASVIGGLLIGGLTPTASDVLVIRREINIGGTVR